MCEADPFERLFSQKSDETRDRPLFLIDLSPDYRFTTIGYPNRDLIWILSRTPEMSEKDYARALEVAKLECPRNSVQLL